MVSLSLTISLWRSVFSTGLCYVTYTKNKYNSSSIYCRDIYQQKDVKRAATIDSVLYLASGITNATVLPKYTSTNSIYVHYLICPDFKFIYH